MPLPVGVDVAADEGVGLELTDAPVLGVSEGVGEKERVGQRIARIVPDSESAA